MWCFVLIEIDSIISQYSPYRAGSGKAEGLGGGGGVPTADYTGRLRPKGVPYFLD